MASPQFADNVSNTFDLGRPMGLLDVKIVPRGQRTEGSPNVYRLLTDRGDFAVRDYGIVLASDDRDVEAQLHIERTWFDGGVPVAEPLTSTDGKYAGVTSRQVRMLNGFEFEFRNVATVHRWSEHISQREAMSTSANQLIVADKLGVALAKLHGISWRQVDRPPEYWMAPDVFPAAMRRTLGPALRILDTPPTVTFEALVAGDVHGENILFDADRNPTLIDFEFVTVGSPLGELADVAAGFDVFKTGSPSSLRKFATRLYDSYFNALDRPVTEKAEARKAFDYYRLEALANSVTQDFGPETIRAQLNNALTIDCTLYGIA